MFRNKSRLVCLPTLSKVPGSTLSPAVCRVFAKIQRDEDIKEVLRKNVHILFDLEVTQKIKNITKNSRKELFMDPIPAYNSSFMKSKDYWFLRAKTCWCGAYLFLCEKEWLAPVRKHSFLNTIEKGFLHVFHRLCCGDFRQDVVFSPLNPRSFSRTTVHAHRFWSLSSFFQQLGAVSLVTDIYCNIFPSTTVNATVRVLAVFSLQLPAPTILIAFSGCFLHLHL